MDSLTTGEFSRWLESDRVFKSDVIDRLTEHGERLARIEAVRTDAARAEAAAVSTKKWAVVGGAMAAVINGFLLVFGSGAAAK
jgi:hypothetical protein